MYTSGAYCYRVCMPCPWMHFVLSEGLNVLPQSKLMGSGCDSDDITLVTHILLDGEIPTPLCILFKVTLTCHTASLDCQEVDPPPPDISLAMTVNNGGCGEEMNRGQEPQAGTEG